MVCDDLTHSPDKVSRCSRADDNPWLVLVCGGVRVRVRVSSVSPAVWWHWQGELELHRSRGNVKQRRVELLPSKRRAFSVPALLQHLVHFLETIDKSETILDKVRGKRDRGGNGGWNRLSFQVVTR